MATPDLDTHAELTFEDEPTVSLSKKQVEALYADGAAQAEPNRSHTVDVPFTFDDDVTEEIPAALCAATNRAPASEPEPAPLAEISVEDTDEVPLYPGLQDALIEAQPRSLHPMEQPVARLPAPEPTWMPDPTTTVAERVFHATRDVIEAERDELIPRSLEVLDELLPTWSSAIAVGSTLRIVAASGFAAEHRIGRIVTVGKGPMGLAYAMNRTVILSSINHGCGRPSASCAILCTPLVDVDDQIHGVLQTVLPSGVAPHPEFVAAFESVATTIASRLRPER